MEKIWGLVKITNQAKLKVDQVVLSVQGINVDEQTELSGIGQQQLVAF